MKSLDKETVKTWIEQDISWRMSKYQYPLASYYSYLKQKCSILGYYTTDIDDILHELVQDEVLEKWVANEDYSYSIKTNEDDEDRCFPSKMKD